MLHKSNLICCREPPSAGTQTGCGFNAEIRKAPRALCTPEPAVGSPVRLRVAATLLGAPLHPWLLPASATIPFALEGVRCAQVIDQESWAR